MFLFLLLNILQMICLMLIYNNTNSGVSFLCTRFNDGYRSELCEGEWEAMLSV